MTDRDGFVKLWRKSRQSRVFQNADLWKVWTWCLMKANHEKVWVPIKTGRGTTEIEINPGQFIFGRHKAAKELKMKPSSIRDRMKKLERMQNVTMQTGTHFSVISIINWNRYQGWQKEDQQPIRQATDNQPTTNRQPTDTNKNDKNDKNIYNGQFLTFWNAYPKKKKKNDAFKVWKNLKVDNGLLGEILKAIESQKKSNDWKKDGGQFIPHPATWLRSGSWEDEVFVPEVETPKYTTDADIKREYG